MAYSRVKPEPWNHNRGGVAPAVRGLWDELICLVAAQEGGGLPYDSITRRSAVMVGTQGWASGPRGASLYSSDASPFDGGWDLGDIKLSLTEVTVIIHKRKTDATNRASGGFGPITNTTNLNLKKCGTHLPYSDGTVYWDFGDNTGDGRLSVAGLTMGDDLWAFTAGARGMEIWQNGFLRASKTQHLSRTDVGDSMYLGNGNTDTGSRYVCDQAEFAFFAVWNRQLSMGECAALTVDPWPLIRWAPARVKVGAGGGGAGSSSNLLLLGVG